MRIPRLVWIVMMVSFLIAAALAVHAGAQMRFPDEREWTALSFNLLNLHFYTLDGVKPTACRPPGFPGFLGLFHWMGLHIVALRIVNVCLFELSVLLLYLLARTAGPPASASLAVLGVLAFPLPLYTASTLLPQTLGTALLLGSLVFLLASGKLTASKAVAAGLCWAALALSIPTFLLLLPVLCGGLFLWKRRDFGRQLI